MTRVEKIIAVGKNYVVHAAEEGAVPLGEPLLFAKFPSAIVGPEAPIRWRAADTREVDWEAELAVVIGRRTRDVALGDAPGAVLGYTCLNDVSARDLQFGDGQWTRAKSLDTFCPVGPWLVTTDDVPDPGALSGSVASANASRTSLVGVSTKPAYRFAPVAELIRDH